MQTENPQEMPGGEKDEGQIQSTSVASDKVEDHQWKYRGSNPQQAEVYVGSMAWQGLSRRVSCQ